MIHVTHRMRTGIEHEEPVALDEPGFRPVRCEDETAVLLDEAEAHPRAESQTIPYGLGHDESPGGVNGNERCHDTNDFTIQATPPALAPLRAAGPASVAKADSPRLFPSAAEDYAVRRRKRGHRGCRAAASARRCRRLSFSSMIRCMFARAASLNSWLRRIRSRVSGLSFLFTVFLSKDANDLVEVSVDRHQQPPGPVELTRDVVERGLHVEIVSDGEAACKMTRQAAADSVVPGRQAATASAVAAFSNTSSPSLASTTILSPFAKSPSSRRRASGFSTRRWIARLSGRAP